MSTEANNATTTDRQKHLAWCKTRALQYVASGSLAEAVSSMLSDLNKHPGTALATATGGTLMVLGMMDAQRGDQAAVRRWVEGFN